MATNAWQERELDATRDGHWHATSAAVAERPLASVGRDQKSRVLSLAYREYLSRTQAGETIVPSTFCSHFPAVRRSLLRMINLHSWVHRKPKLAKALEGLAWPEADAQFLGFDIVDEIGRGAFARVYLATQQELGNRHVVLKVTQGGGGEARMLGRLVHPSIVPVYSVTRDDESQLFVMCMPYLGEATLSDVLDTVFTGQQMPDEATVIVQTARRFARLDAIPETATVVDPLLARTDYVGGVIYLMIQLAEALDHAHCRGILHRDLKPSNILLMPSGRPMLLDFNLSSDMERDAARLGGTLPYMSPEQIRATVLEPDFGAAATPRWDVFALGVIMYELLTGQLPFGDVAADECPEHVARYLLARQRQGCAPVRSINPFVPHGLTLAVESCIAVEPQMRPESAAELAGMLRKQMVPAARLRRWVRRRRLLVATAGSALALAGAAGARWTANRPPRYIRNYRSAVTAFQSGQIAAAIKQLDEVSRGEHPIFQARMALGQMRSMRGQYIVATQDLRNALKQLNVLWRRSQQEPALAVWQPEIVRCMGVTASWLAYAFGCVDGWIPVEYYAKMATEQLAVNTTSIWNNRALRALKVKYWPLAADYCSRAIRLDKKCQPAFYSRAIANYQQALKDPSAHSAYAQAAVADIEQAMKLGPCDQDLYLYAAQIHAQCGHASGTHEDVAKKVRTNIIRALDCGAPRKQVLNDVLVRPFINAEIRAYQPVVKSPRRKTPRLIAPDVYFSKFSENDTC